MRRTTLFEGETLAGHVAEARTWLEAMEAAAARHLELRLRGRVGARVNPPETGHVRAALTMLEDVEAALATVTRERDEARETAVELHRRLTTRPLAVCAYCAAPMPESDPMGASSEERMAWMDAHMRACPDHPMSAVIRERDELRAALLNERGEGTGPSEGWAWTDGVWERGDGLIVFRDEDDRWCFEGAPGVYLSPDPNTARETMRQADTKLPLADTALAGAKS